MRMEGGGDGGHSLLLSEGELLGFLGRKKGKKSSYIF